MTKPTVPFGPSRALVLGAFVAVALLALAGCRHKPVPDLHPNPSASVDVTPTLVVDASVDATSAATDDSPDAGAAPVVREEATVVVDGKTETWRLVWRTPPSLDCVDDHWWTCPCAGFAFGETGPLDLVRTRADGSEDRLSLGQRTVQHWIPSKAEIDEGMTAGIAGTEDAAPPTRVWLAGHPVAKIMKIGDYDHDGRATELVFQVAAGPCFHKAAVLVGLERKIDRLHVFADTDAAEADPESTAPDDERAISLEPSEWEKVRAGLPRTFTSVPCGDHGATESELVSVSRGPRGLRAKSHQHRCP